MFAANTGSSNISGFQVQADGNLAPLPSSPFSTVQNPRSLATDGKHLLVANGFDNNGLNGQLTLFAIDSKGQLAQASTFATSPSSVAIDPKGNFGYDSETGIGAYSLANQQIGLLPNSPTFYGDPQNNPLAADLLKMDPGGDFLYASFYPSNFATAYGDFGVVTLNSDGTAGAFAPGSPAPSCYIGGDLALARETAKTFVYESCADPNADTAFNISAFAVDQKTGALTSLPSYTGATGGLATGMATDPSGQWLAALDVNNDQLLLLKIDPSTGALSLAHAHKFPTGHRPNSAIFDKSGKFLYVSNGDFPWFMTGGSNDISIYSFDPSTGIATPLKSSPTQSGGTTPGALTLVQ